MPQSDGKLGFGGSCFPRDLNALLCLLKDLNLPMSTLQGVWDTNLQVRKERDWEALKGRDATEIWG